MLKKIDFLPTKGDNFWCGGIRKKKKERGRFV
jgi:hypothetical protein